MVRCDLDHRESLQYLTELHKLDILAGVGVHWHALELARSSEWPILNGPRVQRFRVIRVVLRR
jgi:hypothetical protein